MKTFLKFCKQAKEMFECSKEARRELIKLTLDMHLNPNHYLHREN